MASFTLSAFLCVALLSSTSLESEFCKGPCREGWVYNNMRCFQYVLKRLNWLDAETNCVSIGGSLASVHTPGDHAFLKELQSNNGDLQPFWIGLSDLYEEGTWIWSDGTGRKFKKWNSKEPNNYGGDEDCVLSNWRKKDWNDVPCSGRWPSICSMGLH